MSSSKIRKFKHDFGSSVPLNSAPTLTTEIQASLLHVGMRIRKSISQGYRTQWALEEDKFRSWRTQNLKLTSRPILWEDEQSKADQDFFPSSQESTSSVESDVSALQSHVPGSAKKRSYIDEEEQDNVGDRMEASSTCLRPIAQAVSRKRLGMSKKDLVEIVAKNTEKLDDTILLDSVDQNDDMNRSFQTDVDF